MKVREIICTEKCSFYDCKGNPLEKNTALSQLGHWTVFSTSCPDNLVIDVKVIAPIEAARNFLEDVKGSIRKELVTLEQIASSMNLTESVCQAWLWSCARYGIAQREFCGSEIFWAI